MTISFGCKTSIHSIDSVKLGNISDEVTGMDFVPKVCEILIAARAREAEAAGRQAA